MEKISLLAIDIAKNVFQLHGVDVQGKVILRSRLTRAKLIEFVGNLQHCLIVMEACGGANAWARKFDSFGHEVKLISPQFVKPFVKTNKTDKNDAEAICEADSRPSMRFVSPKTVEQQDIQSLHRIRKRLVNEWTSIANQIRGLLMEYGLIISQGINNISKFLPEMLEDATNKLSVISRRYLNVLYIQMQERTLKIKEYEVEIRSIFNNSEACKKISKIEGIGLITATAIISCIGSDVNVFKNGRHLAAFLGLVPRQNSSGNKQKLLGISKRGDTYIRTLLIHGARAVIRTSKLKEDPRSRWVQSIKAKRGSNKAAVALANKNARIVWALLATDTEYKNAA